MISFTSRPFYLLYLHGNRTRSFTALVTYLKVKVKWSRYRPGVAQRVGRGIALLLHDRGTRRGWVVSSTPRPHFTPGKDPVPIVQEAGWAPGPVWTGGKSLFNCLLSFLFTPWSRVFLEKLPVVQLVKKFFAFYETCRFITAFTRARHLSLSWASSIQPIPPHSTSWSYILILYFHLRLGLPSCFSCETVTVLIWYGMARYGMVWYDMVWYMIWYDVIRCDTMW